MLAVEGSRLARIIVLQNSRHLHAVISHIFSGPRMSCSTFRHIVLTCKPNGTPLTQLIA